MFDEIENSLVVSSASWYGERRSVNPTASPSCYGYSIELGLIRSVAAGSDDKHLASEPQTVKHFGLQSRFSPQHREAIVDDKGFEIFWLSRISGGFLNWRRLATRLLTGRS